MQRDRERENVCTLYFTHNNTTEIIIQGVQLVKGYSVHLFQSVLLKTESWNHLHKAFKHFVHSMVFKKNIF